jgi:uncharacterized protein YlzI (FlbEa/FlbD family)
MGLKLNGTNANLLEDKIQTIKKTPETLIDVSKEEWSGNKSREN